MLRRGSAWVLLLAVLAAACSGPAREGRSGQEGAYEAQAQRQQVAPLRAWGIRHAGRPREIEGFADHVSVLPGQPVRLFVSTLAPTYGIRVFRMGWYGGQEGVQVWHSPTLQGHVQPPTVVEPRTHAIVAPWRPSFTLPTRGLSTGDYLIRLDASTGAQRYVPLTVRAASAVGRVVIINAVTTWQAYNEWGGYDLYLGGTRADFEERARVVSFDRPYVGAGDGQFLTRELPLVALAEKLRLALDYVTDVDLDLYPNLLRGARAVISLGHDEYWSLPMRAAATRARDAGTNLAFLGANAVFRRIRFAASPLGPDRLEVNYKIAKQDPLDKVRAADTTADWQDPPKPDPPSTLLGTSYNCSRARGDLVVVDPHNWLFEGTGVESGTRFPRAVGIEIDRVSQGSPRPADLEVLAHSPAVCGREKRTWSDMTYYTVRSGAGVFSSGTIAWVCVLGRTCGGFGDPLSQRLVTQITTRLLEVFSAGPAGRLHPAHGNVQQLLGFRDPQPRPQPTPHPSPSVGVSTARPDRPTTRPTPLPGSVRPHPTPSASPSRRAAPR